MAKPKQAPMRPSYPESMYWTLIEGLAQLWIRDDIEYDDGVKDELMNGIHILRQMIDI